MYGASELTLEGPPGLGAAWLVCLLEHQWRLAHVEALLVLSLTRNLLPCRSDPIRPSDGRSYFIDGSRAVPIDPDADHGGRLKEVNSVYY